MTERLTIGRLAKASGVGIDTVRFYERRGLISRGLKADTSFREYAPDDAKRIRFIKRAQELGFTLAEIKELLQLRISKRATCAQVKAKSEAKLEEIEQKIRDLKRMKRSLRNLSEQCNDGPAPIGKCPILDCFESGGCL
jgi:MerR family mercuric resistance operon transcriptional regulator